MSKRTIIYIRTEQDSPDGIKLQHEACATFCKEHDLTVVGTLAEIASGYGLSDRPKLDILRQMVRDGAVDVVVVYNLGRLTRSTEELTVLVQEAETHHVDVVSIFELLPGEDITPLRAEAMISERERAATVLCRIEQDRIARHRLAAQAQFR